MSIWLDLCRNYKYIWENHIAINTKVSWVIVTLFTLVIVGYQFVAVVSDTLGQAGTFVSIAYRTLIVLLSLFLILSRTYKRGGGSTIYLYWLCVLSFWAFYLMRVLSDTLINPVHLTLGFKEYYQLAIGATLLPMIALMRPLKSKDLEMAFMVTLVVGVVTSVLIMNGVASAIQEGGFNFIGGRLALEKLNPISIGHLGVTTIIISIYTLSSKLNAKKITRKKLFYIGALIIGIITSVMAASNGPLLSLIVVLLLFYTAGLKKGGKIKSLLILTLGAVILYQSAQYAEEHLGFVTVSKIINISTAQSTHGRLISFEGAWNQFVDNPILGSSLEEKVTGSYPHNVILESFMATGILGGGIFLLLIIISVWKSYNMVKYDIENALLGLLYIQYLAGAMVSGAIWGSSQMWVLMGIVLAARLKSNIKKSTQPELSNPIYSANDNHSVTE